MKRRTAHQARPRARRHLVSVWSALALLMVSQAALAPVTLASTGSDAAGPSTVVEGGACTFLATLSLTFSPNLDTTSTSPAIGLSGPSTTCEGLPLGSSISLNYSTLASTAFTCAGGLAILGGWIDIPNVGPVFNSATVIDEGTSVEVIVDGGGATGVGEFTWSTVASIKGCALGQTGSTNLDGAFVFSYT